jgi:hypothetical protein
VQFSNWETNRLEHFLDLMVFTFVEFNLKPGVIASFEKIYLARGIARSLDHDAALQSLNIRHAR